MLVFCTHQGLLGLCFLGGSLCKVPLCVVFLMTDTVKLGRLVSCCLKLLWHESYRFQVFALAIEVIHGEHVWSGRMKGHLGWKEHPIFIDLLLWHCCLVYLHCFIADPLA